MFKLGIGMTSGYPRNDVVFQVERSKGKITGSISSFFTLITITPTLIHIWLTTAIQHGFLLYEYLIVLWVPSSLCVFTEHSFCVVQQLAAYEYYAVFHQHVQTLHHFSHSKLHLVSCAGNFQTAQAPHYNCVKYY